MLKTDDEWYHLMLVGKAMMFLVATWAIISGYFELRKLNQEVILTMGVMRDEVQKTNRNVIKTLEEIHTDIDEGYDDVRSTNETTAVMTRSAAEIVRRLEKHLFGGMDYGIQLTGVMPSISIVLNEVSADLYTMSKDASNISRTSVKSIDALTESLGSINLLLKDVDTQVKSNGGDLDKTLISVDKAVNDLDILLRNEDVIQTLYHVNHSAESVDIALQPLRDKVSRLKLFLKFLLNFVRVSVPVK